MAWVFGAGFAFFFYLYVRSESQRADEQCTYRQNYAELRDSLAIAVEPGSDSLFEAACQKAREEDAAFEASVMADINRLPSKD